MSSPFHLPTLRQAALQLYRLGVLVAIAWVIRAHHLRLRIEGDAPISVAEVTPLYPGAAELRPDPGERRGLWVHDAQGKKLGYVVRTMPDAASDVGYRGWTDTLVAFDPALHVVGVRVRDSQDTKEHVGDVRDDRYYLKTWNGKSWDAVAGKTPEQFGIEGVSGATMTSMAMAEGIMRRLADANAALTVKPPPIHLSWRDAGLIAIILAAIVLAFTGTHGRRWLRRGFQLLVIVYVGFLSGDLLAQSLMAGWAAGGVPWRSAPGLVLLLAAALAVPWTTGKPLYCQHLCPHGAAQELLHAVGPKRWRLTVRKDIASGLRWLPPGLLAVVLFATIWLLPIDLAHLEPFDAYLVKSAGIATIAIALGGLLSSLFVPMAYCHYGCPTGALLNFIRGHGKADRFGRRDAVALLLLALAIALASRHPQFHAWTVAME